MAARPTVYITDFWTKDPDVERAALAGVADIVALGAHREDDLLPRIIDAAALLSWHDITLGRETIRQLPRCKVIVRVGVGFDNVDIAAAREQGIPVCNVPDYGTEDVADHAIALLLALVRNLPQFQADFRAPLMHWNARRCERTPRLRGMTFGIVGLGRIGSATALRAKAFGMNVIANDPFLADGAGKAIGVRMVDSLAELLSMADIVSLHAPLNESSRNMINARALAGVKRGAILINTARGGICDTAALLAALEDRRLAGIGLDVLPTEPAVMSDPLVAAARDPQHVAHHRVLITPHSAFYTEEGSIEMRTKAALEARRAILGERLRNVVN